MGIYLLKLAPIGQNDWLYGKEKFDNKRQGQLSLQPILTQNTNFYESIFYIYQCNITTGQRCNIAHII